MYSTDFVHALFCETSYLSSFQKFRLSRVATVLENLGFSGIVLKMENSVNLWENCIKQSSFSLSLRYLRKTAVDWVNMIWHGQSVVVTCYIAGVDVEWPSMKVIIAFNFCNDNLWNSKFIALEKPGKLREFFPHFLATLLSYQHFSLLLWDAHLKHLLMLTHVN